MSDLRTIMYVEDDADIQVVVEMALSAIGGFDVTLCSSGAEAVQVAAANPPDLILLDVMMPSMDGPTTMARMREIPALATTPVVFITAKVQPDEVAFYMSLGAMAVVAKPFDPLTLADELRSIWASRPA